MALIYQAVPPMASQKRREIKRNLLATIDALPRWGRRVSKFDRNLLIQALADLELLYAAVGEAGHTEDVLAAAAKFHTQPETAE